MPRIWLSGRNGEGKYALVDDDDFALYGHMKWHMSDTGYALRTTKVNGITIRHRLHRLIAEAPEDMVVDHLNGNKLDNRRSNLRVCTQKDNANNRKGVTGVCFDRSRSRWIVRYKSKFHGRYDTEQEAIDAFRKAKSGVEYKPKQRKQYMLPKNIHKQFGKYNVSVSRGGVRIRKNGLATLDEALAVLKTWQKAG